MVIFPSPNCLETYIKHLWNNVSTPEVKLFSQTIISTYPLCNIALYKKKKHLNNETLVLSIVRHKIVEYLFIIKLNKI